MRIAITLTVLCFAAAFAAHGGDGRIDYDHQERWQAAHDTAQSPIDIVTHDAVPAAAGEPRALQFTHTRAPMEAVDNGHALEVERTRPTPPSAVATSRWRSSTSMPRASTRSTASITRWKAITSSRYRTAVSPWSP